MAQDNGPRQNYRVGEPQTWTVASGVTTAAAGLDIRRYGMGQLNVTAGTVDTDTSITFTGSDALGGTYHPIHDEDGTVVTLTFHATKEDKWYTIPARVMEAHFLKPLFATGQTGGLTIKFLGKT